MMPRRARARRRDVGGVCDRRCSWHSLSRCWRLRRSPSDSGPQGPQSATPAITASVFGGGSRWWRHDACNRPNPAQSRVHSPTRSPRGRAALDRAFAGRLAALRRWRNRFQRPRPVPDSPVGDRVTLKDAACAALLVCAPRPDHPAPRRWRPAPGSRVEGTVPRGMRRGCSGSLCGHRSDLARRQRCGYLD